MTYEQYRKLHFDDVEFGIYFELVISNPAVGITSKTTFADAGDAIFSYMRESTCACLKLLENDRYNVSLTAIVEPKNMPETLKIRIPLYNNNIL